MSHWDSVEQRIIRWPTQKVPNHPGWLSVDCGCCAGIEWGGETPRECRNCKGSGAIFLHIKSRRIAEYPGGPLLGMWHTSDVEHALATK